MILGDKANVLEESSNDRAKRDPKAKMGSKKILPGSLYQLNIPR